MDALQERHWLELGNSRFALRRVAERTEICLCGNSRNGSLLHQILPDESSTASIATTTNAKPANFTTTYETILSAVSRTIQPTTLVETERVVKKFTFSPRPSLHSPKAHLIRLRHLLPIRGGEGEMFAATLH